MFFTQCVQTQCVAEAWLGFLICPLSTVGFQVCSTEPASLLLCVLLSQFVCLCFISFCFMIIPYITVRFLQRNRKGVDFDRREDGNNVY